jgi:hypothetical protein
MFDIKFVKGDWPPYHAHENLYDPDDLEWSAQAAAWAANVSKEQHGEICHGKIRIYGSLVDNVESFPVYLDDTWSVEMYKKQWVEAVERILDPKFDSSVLITERSVDGLVTWPMYRVGGNICLMNRHIVYSHAKEIFGKEFDLKKAFDWKYVLEFVEPYESVIDVEDDMRPEEWVFGTDEIRDFLQRHKQEK